ncbi:MAG: S8 family serine peptidase, partial [Candidatus Binatia bacterium]
MLATAGTGSAGATVCGDADGNGIVTTNDGVRILVIAATDGTCDTDGCDVDGNGRIGVTDAVLTLRRAVGLSIVDHCGPGAITGRLLVLPAATTAIARSEHEPNDGPGTAEVVGRLATASVRRIHGTLDADDPLDAFTFTSTGGVHLSLDLTFPTAPTIDLDLLIDDRHGHDVTCESATRGRERCEVSLDATAAEAFDVVVAPATGSAPADYTLVVRAQRSRAVVNRIRAGRGAGAPIDLEPAVYRGEAAPIATGEIILQMAGGSDDPAPPATGSVGRATLAAVVGDAGLTDELAPAIVAPDGTALVVLPATRANAARLAGSPVSTRTAKRAHAADRARTREVAARLVTSPHVVIAEPNRVVRAARVPTDPRFPEQWHLETLDLPDAWNTTIGNPQAIVAVIDTGIRSDHPDLAGRLVAGFDFISNPARANDGDGLDPDPFDPGDLPTTPEGGTFHGTHVAGTIGATTNNAIGVAGVTWRTAVMPLRVLGVSGGTVFDVAQAIRFAARLSNSSGTLPPRRADVINLSLTTSGDDPVLRNAVDAATAAGVLVVAAAGNTGSNGFLSPAGFPNVVSVAATDRLGNPARYSNFGPTITVAAPGGDTHHDRDADGRPDGILSTRLPGLEPYALMQGTSMASAHASGVAALLLGVPGSAGVSPSRLREILLATADDRGTPGRDDRYGAGILNAARAVRMLAGTAPPDAPILRLETPSVRVA